MMLFGATYIIVLYSTPYSLIVCRLCQLLIMRIPGLLGTGRLLVVNRWQVLVVSSINSRDEKKEKKQEKHHGGMRRKMPCGALEYWSAGAERLRNHTDCRPPVSAAVLTS